VQSPFTGNLVWSALATAEQLPQADPAQT